MRPRLFVIIAAVLVGCGGGGQAPSVTGTPPATAELPTLASTTEPSDRMTEALTEAATTEATTGVTAEADFCEALREVVLGNAALIEAVFNTDQAGVDAYRSRLPDLATAVRDSAPDQVAADMDLVLSATEDLLARLEGVDLESGDVDLEELFAGLSDPEFRAASGRVGTYARETCGFDPATLDNPEGSEAPEPPDACGLLDLEPVAAAAGVELDATDGDGTGTYNGGDFASNSCSYGNGAATVSTNTFASSDVAEQRQLYVDLAEGNNGSVLDADLGDLPDTTVVTEVSGFTQITVFEATPSFSLAFTGVSDPDALVAAAEVALAQLG